MAIAAGPSTNASGINGGSSVAMDSSGMSGFVAIVAKYHNGPAAVLTDSKSNTWTAKGSSFIDGDGHLDTYYAYNPTVGSGHTFTISGTEIYASLAVCAFSGMLLTDPFNGEAGATSGSAVTTIQAGSLTPTQNGDVVIAALCQMDVAALLSINLGYTIVQSLVQVGGVSYGIGLAYLIQTTAAATNPAWSWTSSVNAAARIFALKEAAGGGGGRTTKNTRPWSLGVELGMGVGMPT